MMGVQAVHTIHEARIVHSDLKPANFLVVEGQLKLIDFGIAKAISSDTTSIAREAQVGQSPILPLFRSFMSQQVSAMI
jgi:serine/threonine-protein kinase TTK/MPS1